MAESTGDKVKARYYCLFSLSALPLILLAVRYLLRDFASALAESVSAFDEENVWYMDGGLEMVECPHST